MESLRAKLLGLRCPVSGESKHFIPLLTLSALLTLAEIRATLNEYSFQPWYDLDDLSHRIHGGAKRIFAILALAKCKGNDIIQFLENDNFQDSPLDHKLPFSLPDLKNVAPSIAIEFYEKQWEVCAPVFCKNTDHRKLDQATSLPFLENFKLSQGGFGEIYSISVHRDHLLMGSKDELKLVRKQFPEVEPASDRSHEQELFNLCLLNQIRHPNILELVSFYTYQNRRNFVFPLAQDGDLEKLFRSEARPTGLESDFSIWKALSGLSSALDKMHSFTSEKRLDLNLIGLHRDLKPSNILVHMGNFILADFGLSKFKQDQDLSRTKFTGGGGDFLAPECEDIEEGMKKGTIGRASDIWSFGCILLEVLTFMRRGRDGVAVFRQTRKVKVPGWTLRTFHAPGGKLNEHVKSLLEELEMDCKSSDRLVLRLARNMLQIEPDLRPKAAQVTRRLRFIAIAEQIESLDAGFKSLSKITKSSQAHLEHQRFQSWVEVLGFATSSARLEYEINFDESIHTIDSIKQEVSSIIKRHELAAYPLFSELRRLMDLLIQLTPSTVRTSILLNLEHRLLDEDENFAVQVGITQSDPSSVDAIQHRVNRVRFMRRLSKAADEASISLTQKRLQEGKSDLSLPPDTIIAEEPFHEHHFGSKTTGEKVLIEWIRYDSHWEGQVGDELVQRVGNIVVFLHDGVGPVSLEGLLRCSGFFHSSTREAFGLVYELPLPEVGSSPPKSLYTMIKETRQHRKEPTLGERFALATRLATTVLNIHQSCLLHKSISSYNIIDLGKQGSSTSPGFFLIGFNHIRPNHPKAFTEGPAPSLDAIRYHHPAYTTAAMRRGERFRLEFDYYSLGLVLLEIGLWDTIVKNTDAKSAEEMKRKLLLRRVPLLGPVTGTMYRDVVKACLDGSFGSICKDDREVLDKVWKCVITPLQQVKA